MALKKCKGVPMILHYWIPHPPTIKTIVCKNCLFKQHNICLKNNNYCMYQNNTANCEYSICDFSDNLFQYLNKVEKWFILKYVPLLLNCQTALSNKTYIDNLITDIFKNEKTLLLKTDVKNRVYILINLINNVPTKAIYQILDNLQIKPKIKQIIKKAPIVITYCKICKINYALPNKDICSVCRQIKNL